LALKYAGAEARADLGILKAAMQKNARAYQYACEEAWNSKDFVLEAVKQTQDVSLLQYASEDLRADGGLLCAAARVDPSAIRYAAEAAWSERDFVLVAVRQKGILLQRASEELRADRMVVLEAAEQDVKAVEFASEALWSDEEFVFEAVQLQGSADPAGFGRGAGQSSGGSRSRDARWQGFPACPQALPGGLPDDIGSGQRR